MPGHGEAVTKPRHGRSRARGSLPEAGGARGAGMCSAAGTVLGVAGAACPAPRRGSFPYKEFGWSPSSGSRTRLRLPHSSQPRPCRGRCCPGPALTENPASPPAVGFKVGGCVSLLFLGCDGWVEGWGGPSVWVGCCPPLWDEDASQPGSRMRMEERGSPTLVLLSPPLLQAGAPTSGQ